MQPLANENSQVVPSYRVLWTAGQEAELLSSLTRLAGKKFSELEGKVRISPTARSVLSLFWLADHRISQSREIKRVGRLVKHRVLGVAFELDLTVFHDYLMHLVFADGNLYEPASTRLVLSALSPGDTFVDVGASNGYYSLLSLARVGAEGRVLAFEPHPAAAERFRHNAALNSAPRNLEVFQLALSDSVGGHAFSLHPDEARSSFFPSPGVRAVIQTKTLDEVIQAICPRVVKIDVEGAEGLVLAGMDKTISRCEKLELLVEWNSRSTERLLEDLERHFEVFRVLEHSTKGLVSRVQSYRSLKDIPLCNLWCVRRVVS